MHPSVARKALCDADVTGFKQYANILYLGSTAWIVLLITADAIMIASDDWNSFDAVLATVIVMNVLAYTFQTIDYIMYHFRFWPVTALNWTAQTSAIALTATGVSFALDANTNQNRDMKIVMSMMRTIAQILFTSSQFSVTLEYFERHAPAPVPVSMRRMGVSHIKPLP